VLPRSHQSGSDLTGVRLAQWGAVDSPYYEKAMMMRSRENTLYFASVNYALRFQESATSLIAPSGECQAHLPYGEEGLLVEEIKPELVSGRLARRFAVCWVPHAFFLNDRHRQRPGRDRGGQIPCGGADRSRRDWAGRAGGLRHRDGVRLAL